MTQSLQRRTPHTEERMTDNLNALREALSNLIAMAQPFMTDAPQQLALKQAIAALEVAQKIEGSENGK
jgi:hypothetical protein